jgi:phytoene dehydrogenase-like protein
MTSAANRYDAIVIGAGANGLVAATVLGRAGKRVLVVDGAGQSGGQSRVREFAPGFRAAPFALDAGWLPAHIARGIDLPALAAVTPSHSITAPAGDGSWLAIPSDTRAASDVLRRFSTRDAERWPSFVRMIHRHADVLGMLYSLPAPDIDTRSIRDIASMMSLGRKVRALGRTDMTELLRVLPMPVQDLMDDTFEFEPLKAAVGAGGVRDLQQGPRSGGTTLVLLHYLTGAPSGSARTRAWWRDGPDAFDNVIAAAARAAGVTVRLATPVSSIVVRDDAVAGIVAGEAEEIAAPIVLSTADPVRTLRDLVDPVWLDPDFMHAVRNIRLHGCTAVVQYAVDRLPDIPGLDATVSLTPTLTDLERAYDAAKYGEVSARPHIELTAPTLRWSRLAPQGKHVLVARVQYAPWALRNGAAWDSGRSSSLEQTVTEMIAERVPSFASTILHSEILTPADIAHTFGLTGGALTHGEVMLDQLLFMRPVPGYARYATPIGGLYMGGAGSHPGPGILGGAGWLAAHTVLRRGKMA